MKVAISDFVIEANNQLDQRRQKSRSGFTLVELLTAVTIILTLLSISLPATRSLMSGSSASKSVSELAALFEQARSEAIGRNTYVWLGIQVETSNRYQISTVLFASQDGTVDTTAANVRQISKTFVFTDLRLGEPVGGTSFAQSQENFQLTADRQSSVELNVAGSVLKVFTNVIQINPNGEVSLPPERAQSEPVDAAVAKWINLNMLPTQGLKDLVEKSLEVRIATLTGQVQLIRSR